MRALRPKLGHAIGLGLCLWAPSAHAQAPTPALGPAPPSASEGLELYAQHCIRCHGPFGRGDGELQDQLPVPPRSFAAPSAIRSTSPAEAFEIITNGRIENLMPPWRDALSEAQRWDAVYGAWSFYFTPTRLARAEAAWAATCAECHGVDGGDIASAPLADASWLAELSGHELLELTLGATAHAPLELDADRERLWLAIDFVRSFGFQPLPREGISAGGRIEGRVVNGTAGADSVEGALVRAAPLGVALPGEVVSATIGADGGFLLEDIVYGAEVEHQLSAVYAGVEFPSTLRPTGDPRGADSPLEIAIYETASDVEISLAALHAVLAPVPERGLIEVVERWSLQNGSDRARVAADGDDPTALFGLLAGAIDVRVHDGAPLGSMERVEDTMRDLRPIPPGGREVILIYDVPYESTSLEVARTLDLPLGTHTVTIADPQAGIDGAWAGRRERVELMGAEVEQLVGGPFAIGETVVARIDGLVPPTEAGRASTTDPAALGTVPNRILSQRSIARTGLFGLGLAVLIACGYPFVNRRRGASGQIARTLRQRERVLERLAQLERRNAAGEIAPREYAAERAELIGLGLSVERRLDGLGAIDDAPFEDKPRGETR